MRSDDPSTIGRLWSAIVAMGAWSLALVFLQMIADPGAWLNIAPIGTPTFTIQMIVLVGSAVPFVAAGLAHYFDSKEDRIRS